MRAEIQRFRGFADEKYFFCSYYKMKTSSKEGELPLRTGGKTAEKKALTHKIYGKAPLRRPWNAPFPAKIKNVK
jgi:hypothetical protein